VHATTGQNCANKVDLVFCVDESGSISNANWLLEKKFVKDIVSSFIIGPDNVRVGYAGFADGTLLEFNLNAHNNLAGVTAAIDGTTKIGGGTNIGSCIDLARTSLFTAANGDRADAANVLIVLTDGVSVPATTQAQIDAATTAGIEIIAIGIGSGINLAELQLIASNPDSEHLFLAADFDAHLSELLASVTSIVCKGCDFDFLEAKDFNLFITRGSLIAIGGSDVQGRVGVCGPASLQAFSVGDALPVPSPVGNSGPGGFPAGRHDLVVNGHLSFASGNMEGGGNIVHKDAGSSIPQTVGFKSTPAGCPTCHGKVLGPQAVLDCSLDAFNAIKDVSSKLATYVVNSQPNSLLWGTLTLKGTNADLNVFEVSGSVLNAAHTLVLDIPAGSRALINVGSGGSVTFANKGLFAAGYLSLNPVASNILWNFPNAINLRIVGIEIAGSILAPKAALDYPSGLVRGQVIVKSMCGNGQINYNPFDHKCPPA
jgi:choice-of-anchor A domain-containing protein